MSKTVRSIDKGKALELKFNEEWIDPNLKDIQNYRGIDIIKPIEPGERAFVYFKAEEFFRREDFELYTSWFPATNLKIIVENSFENLKFDFKSFYFTPIYPRTDGDKTEIHFDKGVLPFQGVRLEWKGD